MNYVQHLLSLASIMYIAFGLGSLPDTPPTEGGMLVISIYDEKPRVERRVTESSVFLFTFEL